MRLSPIILASVLIGLSAIFVGIEPGEFSTKAQAAATPTSAPTLPPPLFARPTLLVVSPDKDPMLLLLRVSQHLSDLFSTEVQVVPMLLPNLSLQSLNSVCDNKSVFGALFLSGATTTDDTANYGVWARGWTLIEYSGALLDCPSNKVLFTTNDLSGYKDRGGVPLIAVAAAAGVFAKGATTTNGAKLSNLEVGLLAASAGLTSIVLPPLEPGKRGHKALDNFASSVHDSLRNKLIETCKKDPADTGVCAHIAPSPTASQPRG
jgi:hypothetical protein